MSSSRKISIAGRVDHKDLCIVAQHLKKNGYAIETKSSLLHESIHALSQVVKVTDPEIVESLDLGEGRSFLAELGLNWIGTRAERDWKGTLKEELFEGLSEEEREEVTEHIRALKEAKVKEDDPLSAIGDELSSLDQNLRGGK